jgi:GDPmannose 4,6-dehydratase
MMLQQDTAEDYVIATGKQISVREFVRLSAKELGIELTFSGSGVNDIATVSSVSASDHHVRVGDVIVKVDTAYYQSAEVETLFGDPAKAMCQAWLAATNYRRANVCRNGGL